MKKKILIGSIIAVALLTLVSFSSVVGYSSVKSDSKIASPLFSIKNNKGDISTNYLGKDRFLNLLIPKRTSDNVKIKRIVDYIQKTDDVEFEKIIDYVIFKSKNVEELKNLNDEVIVDVLNEIRQNPLAFKFKEVFNKDDTISIDSLLTCFVPQAEWLCNMLAYFQLIIILILMPLWLPISFIIGLFISMSQPWVCGPFA